MAMLAAGAVVTAEGLWMPGQKLISIPKPRGQSMAEIMTQLQRHWAEQHATAITNAFTDQILYGQSRIKVTENGVYHIPVTD